MVRIEIVDHDTIDVAFAIVQMIWLNMGPKIAKLYREIAILHFTVQQFKDLSVLRIIPCTITLLPECGMKNGNPDVIPVRMTGIEGVLDRRVTLSMKDILTQTPETRAPIQYK